MLYTIIVKVYRSVRCHLCIEMCKSLLAPEASWDQLTVEKKLARGKEVSQLTGAWNIGNAAVRHFSRVLKVSAGGGACTVMNTGCRRRGSGQRC